MRKGTVVSIKSLNKFFDFFLKNKILIGLTFFLLLGFVVSVLITDNYETTEKIAEFCFERFLSSKTNKTFLQIAVKSYFSSMLFVLLGFTFGTSVLGTVFIPFTVMIKGYLYGSIAVTLYSVYSFKGIAFYIVLFLPSALIFIFGFLYALCESFDFSVMLLQLTFPQTIPTSINLKFKRFCLKYLIVIFITLFSALVDAFLCVNFFHIFSLI